MTIRAALLAVVLAVPALAAAQPATPNPGSDAGRARAEAIQRGTDRVEKHIAALHSRLSITAAQEPMWTVFAAVMRANASRMATAWIEHQTQAASMDAIHGLKAYAALERARAEDVERLVPPFEDLYRVLSPDQRVAADRTFREFQRNSHIHGGA